MIHSKLMSVCLVAAVLGEVGSTAHATKVYLMGGAVAATNSLVYQGLRQATGKDWSPNPSSLRNCSADWNTTRCPRVAVVTSAAPDSTAGRDAYETTDPTSGALSYHDLFQKHGFSPRHITLHVDNAGTAAYDGTVDGDANLALVDQADVVFFNGGDQARHARAWLRADGSDTPLLAALRARVVRGSVVAAGTSAGTAIMGDPTYGEGVPYGYIYFNAQLADKSVASSSGLRDDREGTASLRYFENGGKLTGFGFVGAGIAVDTHFDARGRLGRMLPALRSLGYTLGIGVDEDTAFYVDGDVGTVYGSHSVFVVDTRSAHFPTGSHFRITGAAVSLLTSGDRYNLRTQLASSSKPPLGRPYYRRAYDSDDVFAAYEITASITRTVDTLARVCRGSAVVPSYATGPRYPDDAPLVNLRFYRGSATQGFYGGGRYTALKVLVDID